MSYRADFPNVRESGMASFTYGSKIWKAKTFNDDELKRLAAFIDSMRLQPPSTPDEESEGEASSDSQSDWESVSDSLFQNP